MSGDITVTLTPWELERLTLGCAVPNALTYITHESRGILRPDEIAEGNRWKALAHKLKDAK